MVLKSPKWALRVASVCASSILHSGKMMAMRAIIHAREAKRVMMIRIRRVLWSRVWGEQGEKFVCSEGILCVCERVNVCVLLIL